MATRNARPRASLPPKAPDISDAVVISESRDAALFDDGASDTNAEDYQSMKLQALLAELGESEAESKVVIFKREAVNGIRKKVRLYECGTAEFSFTDLQENYGPGDYTVIVYGDQTDAQGRKYYGIRSNQSYSLGALPPKRGTVIPGAIAPAGNDVAAAVSAALAPVVEMMKQLSKPAGGNDRREFMQEFAQMATIMRTLSGGAAPAGPDPFEMMDRLMGIMKPSLTDKVAEENPEMGMMMQGLGLIREMFDRSKGQQPAPALASPAADQGAQPAGAPAAPPPEAAPVIAGPLAQLQAYLADACAAAKANVPVAFVAGTVYEQLPAEMLDMLTSDPEWFAQLTAIHADCATWRPWFETLRAKLVTMKAEDDAAPQS